MYPLGQGGQLFAQSRQLQALFGAVEVRTGSDLPGHGLRQGEEPGLHILEDRGEEAVVVISAEFPGGDAVYPDVALRGEIEAAQELYEGGLARAIQAYQGHLLAGL